MDDFKKTLSNSFTPEFVEDLYEVLNKHNVSEGQFIEKTWAYEYHNDNYNDCVSWLNDNDHEDLAEDEGFVSALVSMYENEMDANYGTWDNIENAFNMLKGFEDEDKDDEDEDWDDEDEDEDD